MRGTKVLPWPVHKDFPDYPIAVTCRKVVIVISGPVRVFLIDESQASLASAMNFRSEEPNTSVILPTITRLSEDGRTSLAGRKQ